LIAAINPRQPYLQHEIDLCERRFIRVCGLSTPAACVDTAHTRRRGAAASALQQRCTFKAGGISFPRRDILQAKQLL